MKLTPVKSNMNVVEIGDKKVLFSYQTPVAAIVKIGGMEQAIRTQKKWSNTTSRHITEWSKTFPPYLNNWDTKPQEWFDNLLG